MSTLCTYPQSLQAHRGISMWAVHIQILSQSTIFSQFLPVQCTKGNRALRNREGLDAFRLNKCLVLSRAVTGLHQQCAPHPLSLGFLKWDYHHHSQDLNHEQCSHLAWRWRKEMCDGREWLEAMLRAGKIYWMRSFVLRWDGLRGTRRGYKLNGISLDFHRKILHKWLLL